MEEQHLALISEHGTDLRCSMKLSSCGTRSGWTLYTHTNRDNTKAAGLRAMEDDDDYSSLSVFKVAWTTGLIVGGTERLSSYVKVIRQSNNKHKTPTRSYQYKVRDTHAFLAF